MEIVTTGGYNMADTHTSTAMPEGLSEYEYQTWEEYQAEEWRRTCELTHEDILRICKAVPREQ